MATKQEFVDYILENIDSNLPVRSRKMFGEYAIYYENKVVFLVCDNKLYVKPTEAGKAFIGDIVEAPPYQGAKLYFLIEDNIEDREWLSELFQITANELPEPKKKKVAKMKN